MFEIDILIFAILFEKEILIFNLSTLLLNLFIENEKIIEWIDVRCCELSIAIFWESNLSEICLKMTIRRAFLSKFIIILFNILSILLLIFVKTKSFVKKLNLTIKAVVIEFIFKILIVELLMSIIFIL